jgi:hypothetical protein
MAEEQYVIAVATVVQDFLLLVSAVLIGWYLYETRKMRKAAEEQVAESQALVKASEDQLEGQIKPAIVVRVREEHAMELVNIGNGPALHVELAAVLRGSLTKDHMEGYGFDRIAFLESQQAINTRVRTLPAPGYAAHPSLNGRSLRCEYKSLSGRCYFTVTDFDSEGTFATETHFGEVPMTVKK